MSVVSVSKTAPEKERWWWYYCKVGSRKRRRCERVQFTLGVTAAVSSLLQVRLCMDFSFMHFNCANLVCSVHDHQDSGALCLGQLSQGQCLHVYVGVCPSISIS